MFERFTEKAIKVIMLAQEEARRLGHNFVGTEQVLLGLVGEGTGIAAKTLKSMGVNLKDARIEVEKIIGRAEFFIPETSTFPYSFFPPLTVISFIYNYLKMSLSFSSIYSITYISAK